MTDLPLHPILVHFPIALGILLPFFAILIALLVLKKRLPPISWALITILSIGYLASAKVAEEMGERDEEIVEQVVAETALEAHEEAGEKIPAVALALFLLSIIPLFLPQKPWTMLAFIIISLIATYPLIQAGHTGGELVYKHNAAKAHTNASTANTVNRSNEHHNSDENDDD